MIAVTLIRKLIETVGLVNDCYDLYFWPTSYIGVYYCLNCSYQVVMLEDLVLVSESCVVYIKRGVDGVRALGKSKCLTHVAQGVSYHC